jgi:uncharacterized protein YggU (UPF0235/DUF167 family)
MAVIFQVHAHAGAKKFSLSLMSEKPLVVRAGIPEEPEGGRATRALLSELEKTLSCKVTILAGQKSRRKTHAAECGQEELLQRIKLRKALSAVEWEFHYKNQGVCKN